MRAPAILRLFLLVIAAGGLAPAAQKWIRVWTPHFEMYTTNGEKQAARALQTFEQVRSFFLQNSKSKQAPDELVRIIAFSSEKEYRPYRFNEGAFAFYLRSREHDYIVMQDIEAEHHQVAVHEYTHLIVEHTKMQLPLWLNEGLAEVYSSLEPNGGQKAMVGRALIPRLMTLQQRPWMDWNTLFAVDHNSPFYNQKEKMDIFYAQSWMLTHMVALSGDYFPKFGEFLSSIANGQTAQQAFQKVYGKSVGEVAKDASAYMRRTSFNAAVYNISLNAAELNPQVEQLSPFQSDLALAELLTTRKDTAEEAERKLTALAGQDSSNVEVEEALGYFAWQRNKNMEAIKHFGSAAERGSKNTKMLYDLAGLQQMATDDLPAAAATLQRLLTMQPDHTDARILLAEVEARQKHYGRGLSAIGSVKSIKPDQAYRFFSVSAFIRANMNDLPGAQDAAEKATQFAKTSGEKERIASLAQWIDESQKRAAASNTPPAAAQPPAQTASEGKVGSPAPADNRPIHAKLLRDEGLPKVRGILKSFECMNPGYRLHLSVGSNEMTFEMGKPDEVIIQNEKEIYWNCGSLAPRDVVVVYGKAETLKADGKVAQIIFTPTAK